jgi:hypothetical protein
MSAGLQVNAGSSNKSRKIAGCEWVWEKEEINLEGNFQCMAENDKISGQ